MEGVVARIGDDFIGIGGHQAHRGHRLLVDTADFVGQLPSSHVPQAHRGVEVDGDEDGAVSRHGAIVTRGLAVDALCYDAAMHVPQFDQPVVAAGEDGSGVARKACAVDFVLVAVERVQHA